MAVCLSVVLTAAVTQASLQSMLHKILTAGPSAFNITTILSQAAQLSNQGKRSSLKHICSTTVCRYSQLCVLYNDYYGLWKEGELLGFLCLLNTSGEGNGISWQNIHFLYLWQLKPFKISLIICLLLQLFPFFSIICSRLYWSLWLSFLFFVYLKQLSNQTSHLCR